MKIILYSVLFFGLVSTASAQGGSGACSWHEGVDCSMNRQPDGTVYCNDGWRDSMVQFDFVKMCGQTTDSVQLDMRAQKYIQTELSVPDWSSLNSRCMDTMYKNIRYVERIQRCTAYVSNQINLATNSPQCPGNSKKKFKHDGTTDYYCVCKDGYYNYDKADGNGSQGFCSAGEKPISYEEKMLIRQAEINEATNQMISQNNAPTAQAVNTHSAPRAFEVTSPVPVVNKSCSKGYFYNEELARCLNANSHCQNKGGFYNNWNGELSGGKPACSCVDGYEYDASNSCVLKEQKTVATNTSWELPPVEDDTNVVADEDIGSARLVILGLIILTILYSTINGIRLINRSKATEENDAS